ncbi:MAG: ribosome recycling factor [Burkholderiaceae bacterium]|jgi:ribosome recycling factor|nr:MAG: ribosome recycling factor [Burkholderiaceae bacterium]
MTISDITTQAQQKMDQSIAAFKNNLAKVRTGRANPALLDSIRVESYGNHVPLTQVASVSLLDARTIGIQPWDKGIGPKIEKAIRESDLGLNPASVGNLIRVPMPPMSEDRRREMTKIARAEGEQAKIAIRNARRDANDAIKRLVKAKEASEDEQKRAEAAIQKVTDKHVANIDVLVAAKEKDILEV